MTSDSRVADLLVQWEELHEQGQSVSPEELCAECPELKSELQRRIQILESMKDRLETVPYVPQPVAEPRNELPAAIGRYRVEKLLGRGGFGLVYLAYDDQLQRKVAIKVPHNRLVTQGQQAEAYLAEARTVANLDHPQIVPVYDVGSTADFPCYVVSKYIAGTDLAARIKDARLPVTAAASLVATVAEALHHAHKQGLVHRDIKPGNILLDQTGKSFVADFGLALRDQDAETGARYAGTPAYMSPEQSRGEGHRVDGRSDIFSLGIVFYELLVGRRPFHAETQQKLLEKVATFEPRAPRQYDEEIPKELDRICLKALSKRASERYSTAQDMADDLRLFLGEAPQAGIVPRAADSNSEKRFAADAAKPQASAAVPASDSRPMRIVPKGLRSFDEHDADFFLELLPGPRDRDGLPDSLRFWKTRIEESDADETFSVGLIYGPSGCGKSSLVKAGLLPRLADKVLAVYVEATAEETEMRLLKGLRKRCPALPENLSLKETLAALRRGQGLPGGKKVLIVLDQFEQWLHAKKDEQDAILVQALRHCDGERVQCIVMVRDDFWMAATRFMRELECRLVEGQNSAAVDLFPLRHAKNVLAAFGRAFGALPESSLERRHEQLEFLTQAVTGLAQEGKVISVRLALFAEMMKGKPWTAATLKEVGGTEGVGFTFLEETFSAATAPPEHRLHQKAARAVLKALLPELGTDIKGAMRSSNELLEASGYGNRPRDFDDLIRILDSEIRLITPTDPEGSIDGERGDASPPVHSSIDTPAARYYQLTHDYLVPSLRDWLTRKQKETRRGRAELRLAERTAQWQSKPENRYLPSLLEYFTMVLLVPRKHHTSLQHDMLTKARQVLATRGGIILAVLLVIGSSIAYMVSNNERENGLRQRARTAVMAAGTATSFHVPVSLKSLKEYPDEIVRDALKPQISSTFYPSIAYVRAAYGDVDTLLLCQLIRQSSWVEVSNIVAAFDHDRDTSLAAIHAFAEIPENQEWQLKARLAIVALHLQDDTLANEMCRVDDQSDPRQRTTFIEEFSEWHGDTRDLEWDCRKLRDPGLQSAICLAVGKISLKRPAFAKVDIWKPLVEQWYQTAPHNITHSAAGWVLRQWRKEPPLIPVTSEPSDGHDWFVNSLGLAMLRIQPGHFVRSIERLNESKSQTVTLTRSFFLADREVSAGQFEKFLDDPDYPKEEKPFYGRLGNGGARPDDDHPIETVSWYDAVMFCNWLSYKEGLVPCYERSGKKEILRFADFTGKNEFDEWQLLPSKSGYRLPTEAEWEYACRAGTTTSFASGNDIELLSKYAVFLTGPIQGSAACGSRLPNGWGLFDMHGNVWEWCQDWHAGYPSPREPKNTVFEPSPALELRWDITDPVGPTDGTSIAERVSRGGSWNLPAAYCQSMYRFPFSPNRRDGVHGFRVALGPVRRVE